MPNTSSRFIYAAKFSIEIYSNILFEICSVVCRFRRVPNTGLYSIALALDVRAAGILQFQLFLEYVRMLSHHMIIQITHTLIGLVAVGAGKGFLARVNQMM